MTLLARSSGTLLYQNNNTLYLVKRPAAWTTTFLFVTGLLALLLLANGCIQLFMVDTVHGAQTIGAILLGAGILCALIFWRTLAFRKKQNAKPVEQLETICIIDLANNNLLDGQQNILAPLSTVRLSRSMQLTSSAPKLQLAWKAGKLTIVEGNPFSGGVEAVEKALILKGIKTT